MLIPLSFGMFFVLIFGATNLTSSHKSMKCEHFSVDDESLLTEDSFAIEWGSAVTLGSPLKGFLVK